MKPNLSPTLMNRQIKKPITKPVLVVRNPTMIEQVQNHVKTAWPGWLFLISCCFVTAFLIYQNTGTRVLVAEMEASLEAKGLPTDCRWASDIEGVECLLHKKWEVVSFTDRNGNYSPL